MYLYEYLEPVWNQSYLKIFNTETRTRKIEKLEYI